MNESETVENQETMDDIPVIPSDWAEIKPFQPTITLANGRTLNGYAQRSSIADEVWVYPEDQMSTVDLVMLFGNPVNTSTIVSDTTANEHVEYVGYTNMATIDYGMSGKPTIRMTKPVTA